MRVKLKHVEHISCLNVLLVEQSVDHLVFIRSAVFLLYWWCQPPVQLSWYQRLLNTHLFTCWTFRSLVKPQQVHRNEASVIFVWAFAAGLYNSAPLRFGTGSQLRPSTYLMHFCLLMHFQDCSSPLWTFLLKFFQNLFFTLSFCSFIIHALHKRFL